MQYRIEFDCKRFRHDVHEWIKRFNRTNIRSGREYIKRQSKVSNATLSRLIDDPGKIESVHALLSIADACDLDFMSYCHKRKRDYILVGDL